MGESLFEKLLSSHFAGGAKTPGEEAMVRVDEVVLGDGAAALAYLALEHFGVERVRVPRAVTYVDQVTLSDDGRVADEHAYLVAASRRLGITLSPPGHGVAPVLHLERFSTPGSVAAVAHPFGAALGAAAMLALSVPALDASLALAGEACAMVVPRVWRLSLTGAFPAWVNAVDAALELLRRHGKSSRAGTVLEVTGPALADLPVSERALFASMATELGVVATLFPADDVLQRYLERRGRGDAFTPLAGDEAASFTFDDELDLSALEPMIAKPQSPTNVVPVRFAEATPIGQVMIGAPGFASERDLARVAYVLEGKTVYPGVGFDLNSPTRAFTASMAESGALAKLLAAGVRVHEPSLFGAVGVGQAPPGGRASLRTTTQNYPGASGTKDDRVFLCSAATAAVSAVRGVVSRPSDAGNDPLVLGAAPLAAPAIASGFIEPLPAPSTSESGSSPPPPSKRVPVPVTKGASMRPLPAFDAFPRRGELRALLKVPDDVPLREIAPEGLRGLSFGANVGALADLAFEGIDVTYVKRAKVARDQGGHVIIAGHNFGYGGARDATALALRHLGLRVVIAKSYGGQFRRMLLGAGVLALTFVADADYYPIEPGEILVFDDLRAGLAMGPELTVRRKAQSTFLTRSALSARELSMLLEGGILSWFHATVAPSAPPSRRSSGSARPS